MYLLTNILGMLRAYVGALISTLSRQSVVQADADNVAPRELLDKYVLAKGSLHIY